MQSEFAKLISGCFIEAARTLAPTTDGPLIIKFEGRTGTAIVGSLEGGREMHNAGVTMEFDEQAVVTSADFEMLNVHIEDEIEIGGRALRLKHYEYAYPLVKLGLKEIR